MGNEDYVKDRLENQIKWYESKSKINKKRYHITSFLCITISGLIPILVLIKNMINTVSNTIFDFVFGLSGILLLVLFSLSLLFDYRDKWNHYREVAEKLKREKNLFMNKGGEYKNSPEPEKLLAENVESLISPRHT